MNEYELFRSIDKHIEGKMENYNKYKMGSPKVSVIMGIYNCETTLPSAIESIIGQTYDNWELILYDDGSKDGTYAVAKAYSDKYPNIYLMHDDINRKLSHALNQCVRRARGEYIARMDGDDISHPERLQKQVDFLDSHPEVHLVGTQMRKFDETGYLGILRAPTEPTGTMLRNGVPIFHATIMVRSMIFDTLGGYTESKAVEGVEDLDLWFRFFEHGFRAVTLDDVLYDVRMDQAAIKRRTLSRRIRSIKTRASGYERLGFPKRWLIKPACVLFLKGLAPAWVRKQMLKNRTMKSENKEEYK